METQVMIPLFQLMTDNILQTWHTIVCLYNISLEADLATQKVRIVNKIDIISDFTCRKTDRQA